MRRLMRIAAACAALGACHSPAEPGDVAGNYIATQVNGHALPATVETFTTPDARSCTTTLVQGNLSFGDPNFDFDLSFRTVCDGTVILPGVDRTTGTYTQSGGRVTLQPRLQGATQVSGATLSGGTLSIRGVRASGTTLDLVFGRQ